LLPVCWCRRVFLKEQKRWVIAGIAFNLIASTAAYHWPDLARGHGHCELTAKNDPFKRARGWINLADAVGPYLAAHPGSVLVAEDRELIAHLVYRLHPAEYAAWHPGGTPIDHYELMTTLSRQARPGRPLRWQERPISPRLQHASPPARNSARSSCPSTRISGARSTSSCCGISRVTEP
jgi:hypothetical protein